MKKLILIAALILTGCASNEPLKEIVIKNNYIVRTAPQTLKTLPNYPELLNVETATQTDLAKWINNTQGYIYELESMISVLINFYEKPVVETTAASAPAKKVEQETAYVDPIQRRMLDIK